MKKETRVDENELSGCRKQVAFRLREALVDRVDAYAAELMKAQPGLMVTRTDAVSILLARALDEADASTDSRPSTTDAVDERLMTWKDIVRFDASAMRLFARDDNYPRTADRVRAAYWDDPAVLLKTSKRDLRAALFFEKRAYRFQGLDPEGDALHYVQALVGELVRRGMPAPVRARPPTLRER